MLTATKVKKLQKTLEHQTDDRMPLIFSALGDAGRYRIFRLLQQRKDICVTDIAHVLGVSVSAASQQLKILERTGLVRKERVGQTVCYYIRHNDPLVQDIANILSS